MIMPFIKKTKELGRRLDKGPRRAVPSQAASSEKFATGSNKQQQNLNILQVNISGLQHKTLELTKVLTEHQIHIALIQEALLPERRMTIPGYTLYKCDCKNCQHLVTLVRNDVTATVTNIDNKGSTTDIQKITAWFGASKYTIYNVYCPPKTVCSIPIERPDLRKTIIAGDLNSHSPTWGYPDRDASGEAVEELINSTNLILQQDDTTPPTLLHRASGNKTRPDLTLLSADINNVSEASVLDGIGSDHLPILITVGGEKSKTFTRVARWNYKRANWQGFETMTDMLLPSASCESIEEEYREITRIILSTAVKTIPKGRRKRFKPFWTPELEAKVKERKHFRKLAEKAPTPQNRTQYNKLSAEVKLETKKAKKDRWQKTCAEIDLSQHGHKAWKLLHNLEGKKKRSNPKAWQTEKGEIVSDKRKATILNTHFASVNRKQRRKRLDKGIHRILKQKEKRRNTVHEVFNKNFTSGELELALKKLKQRKAPGPDKITNEMLLHLGSKGKRKILEFINRTWQKSYLPKAWRTATITPILKPGKPEGSPASYRPISLTSSLGKLAERMVNSRLYWWLEQTQTLNLNQAGFRKGMRTEDQLFRFAQNALDASQRYEHTAAVFIDLKQAYDKVWRQGLLLKMQKAGIEGKCYFWIKNFLSERTIQTKVNRSLSKKKTLEEGLPQGSALSCTLFLIFLNDLPNIIKVQKALFADDIIIWTSSESETRLRDKLNQALLTISTFCKFWKLEINTTKTVYNLFSSNNKFANRDLKLRIDGQNIQKDPNPKYLGIVLDKQLNFKTHINNTVKKASKKLRLLKTLASTKWGADKNTLRNLYLGYVRSTMEYANTLQIVAAETTRATLDKVQNSALRFICGGLRSSPTAACEIDANVEPLKTRREKAVLESVERYKRMEEKHPCRKIVDKWTKTSRLQKKSVLHHHNAINNKANLPTNRQPSKTVCDIHPYMDVKLPDVRTDLCNKNVNKQSDANTLKSIAQETIDRYPTTWIHAYTDGSAFNAIANAGLGAWIKLPNNKTLSLTSPCGIYCSNYDAEVAAINEALQAIHRELETDANSKPDVVIFSDSQSALQAIQNWDSSSTSVTEIIKKIHSIKTQHKIEVYLQWIPGHSEIPGNEKADTLAKAGSSSEQPDVPVSMATAKKIIKTIGRQQWLNGWAAGKTGRPMYRYRDRPTCPTKERTLTRQEQCTIFQLRTGHCTLNKHLNRTRKDHPPTCRHCSTSEETVQHHLLECSHLLNIRKTLLPPAPTIQNCLYGTTAQLKNTARYHRMALAAEKGQRSSSRGSAK